MAKSRIRSANLKLSFADAEAILCALPLLDQISADSPMQRMTNAVASRNAAEKLLSFVDQASVSKTSSGNQVRLTAEDIRIIYCAVGFAIDVISGVDTGCVLILDSEWKSELSKHFFILNRLYPVFDGLVDQISGSQ